MKKSHFPVFCRVGRLMILLIAFMAVSVTMEAQNGPALRRPLSPQQPMYLVHIDTWNYADPQKIIDLIPKDIRPYVVMNISLSISHDTKTGQFQVAEYGYEVAKSWMRVCAQNRMWAFVQGASGGPAQFSDFDLTVYEEFFREFPNFLGFNYAEQFWGYDDANDIISPKWGDRMNHFARLLELTNRYGGYLVVSWCGNQWSPSVNPIAMMKRNPAFAQACENYTENYILCEKYTQTSYQSDMESICLGAYLSGYSGHYGIRYDDSGWTDSNGEHANFTMATGGAPHLEHMMLTGQTVIDGPELIWTQCFRETARKATTDGYMMRDWETFPQFLNVTVDIFRKVLDGTVRIPTRQEVIDRTKYVVVNDVNNSNMNDTYSSPQTLFEGLYRMDGDGNYEFNKSFFKKTGRYPTIPTVFRLDDDVAKSFQYQVNRSQYSTRWPNVTSKVTEFNSVFPEEYTGDLYAGRHENGWVIYNPFKTDRTASASIPLKYNTCSRVELTFSQYTASVMKETGNQLSFYLSNYDNTVNTGLKTNVIKIFGSSSEPTYELIKRGTHQTGSVTKDWTDGVLTLTVLHNGPVDLVVNCAGSETGRLTNFTAASLVEPALPPLYYGDRQYEAECFDYKSITSITTGGQNFAVRNYTGQGYLRVGTSSLASIRDTVYALRKGNYRLITRYSVASADVNSLDLYVNGVKVATPLFAKTGNESSWNYVYQNIHLNAGKNVIIYKANKSATASLLIDNIVISEEQSNGVYHFQYDDAGATATSPAAELVSVLSGSAGVIAHTAADGVSNHRFKAYSVGSTFNTGVANLDMFGNDKSDYSIVWKEYQGTTSGARKGMVLRGSGVSSVAEGLQQGYLFVTENDDNGNFILKSYVVNASALVEKTTYQSSFSVVNGAPAWFRATVNGENLYFECSSDSVNWIGKEASAFSDATYHEGATQLIWGVGNDQLGWVVDNIGTLHPSLLVASLSQVTELNYMHGTGSSAVKSFNVYGYTLEGDVTINVQGDFEVSLNPSSGFVASLSLMPIQGNLSQTPVYVRLKSGLDVGKYLGTVTVSGVAVPAGTDFDESVMVSGEVFPVPFWLRYDFNADVAGTTASNPPAANITVAPANSTTAGVVSYTDKLNVTSNAFKVYSAGQRSATGAVDLNLFPKEATNYSVTWKQCITDIATDAKYGVLLRGDASIYGTASTGYAQGLRQGYLFIVYNKANGSAEFRIYKSTASTSLDMKANVPVSSLVLTSGQPVYYRASVEGVNPVALKFEYSTNNSTWTTAASYSDVTSPFANGSTQLVWGLAAANFTVAIDDVIFYGISNDISSTAIESDVADGVIVISEEYYNLNGQRIRHIDNHIKGIFIVRSLMSDGTYRSRKEIVK